MNPAMIKKMQKMQKEMMQAQKDLEESVFKCSAGGVVEVEVKGTKEVISIKIDKEAIEGPEDIEMLEDSLTLALNDAFKQIDQKSSESMGSLSGGLGGLGGLF